MVQYLPIFMMIVLTGLFAAGSFAASGLLTPRRPTSAKEAPYECGIVSDHEPSSRFPVRFYLVAMAFIVLDVEIVFLYPFTLVFRELGLGGLVAIAVFLLVLLVPFAYLLSVGALDWGPRQRVSPFAPAPVRRTGLMQRLSEAMRETAGEDEAGGAPSETPEKAA